VIPLALPVSLMNEQKANGAAGSRAERELGGAPQGSQQCCSHLA